MWGRSLTTARRLAPRRAGSTRKRSRVAAQRVPSVGQRMAYVDVSRVTVCSFRRGQDARQPPCDRRRAIWMASDAVSWRRAARSTISRKAGSTISWPASASAALANASRSLPCLSASASPSILQVSHGHVPQPRCRVAPTSVGSLRPPDANMPPTGPTFCDSYDLRRSFIDSKGAW